MANGDFEKFRFRQLEGERIVDAFWSPQGCVLRFEHGNAVVIRGKSDPGVIITDLSTVHSPGFYRHIFGENPPAPRGD